MTRVKNLRKRHLGRQVKNYDMFCNTPIYLATGTLGYSKRDKCFTVKEKDDPDKWYLRKSDAVEFVKKTNK